MSHYHVPTLTERAPRSGEQRTDTGEWVTPLDGQWSDTDAAACGFLPVTESPQPTPGPDETLESAVALVDGQPVRQWTTRALTADELAARATMTAAANTRADLLAQAAAATTVTKLRAVLIAALDTATI